jgi:hypothetical protein
MFKAQINAAEAVTPYNTYDSVLEKPSGSNLNQNAWLTLQLRIKLNFADSKNPVPGLTMYQGGKFYAKDSDGYLFPLLDWPPFLVTRFQREFTQRAEKTWNWQFLLVTPKTYAELDYQSGGWSVRPNVLCLFRMSVLGPAGPMDTSPAAGPMRAGLPHRIINVVNLSWGTKKVKLDPLDPKLTPNATTPATRDVPLVDGLQWRSNANNYDDSDVFKPGFWNPEHRILSNTVGHEVGHALGQCHIMGLKGNALYQFSGAKANDRAAYGVGSPDPLDSWNIMGGGDRVYLINAVSWRERIARHTGLPVSKWDVTGIMNTPPRRMPSALTGTGLAPAEW